MWEDEKCERVDYVKDFLTAASLLGGILLLVILAPFALQGVTIMMSCPNKDHEEEYPQMDVDIEVFILLCIIAGLLVIIANLL